MRRLGVTLNRMLFEFTQSVLVNGSEAGEGVEGAITLHLEKC